MLSDRKCCRADNLLRCQRGSELLLHCKDSVKCSQGPSAPKRAPGEKAGSPGLATKKSLLKFKNSSARRTDTKLHELTPVNYRNRTKIDQFTSVATPSSSVTLSWLLHPVWFVSAREALRSKNVAAFWNDLKKSRPSGRLCCTMRSWLSTACGPVP